MRSSKKIVEQLHVWLERAKDGEAAFRGTRDVRDDAYKVAWARMDQTVQCLEDVIAFAEGRTQ